MTALGSNEYVKLLETKKEYLTKMLNMTVNFNNNSVKDMENAEVYVSLTDQREEMLDKIKQTDAELILLENAPEKLLGDADFIKIAEDMKNSIKGIVSEFLEADKTASLIAKNISSGLTKNIKDINNGRATTQLYDDLKSRNTARFDRSN